MPDSIFYSGSFTNYDVLDVSKFHHLRIDHGKGFAEGEENKRHINGTLELLESGKNGIYVDTTVFRASAFAVFITHTPSTISTPSAASSGKCEWSFNGGNHKGLYRWLLGWARRGWLSKAALKF